MIPKTMSLQVKLERTEEGEFKCPVPECLYSCRIPMWALKHKDSNDCPADVAGPRMSYAVDWEKDEATGKLACRKDGCLYQCGSDSGMLKHRASDNCPQTVRSDGSCGT